MTPLPALVASAIVLVLLFEFTNGFHDASNMVATMIASRALRPRAAIAIVSVATIAGPLVGGVAVANAIAGMVDLSGLPPVAALRVVIAGLVGAIVWNFATWALGTPSSSSFALFGALGGAAIESGGVARVNWGVDAAREGRLVGFVAILVALFASPIFGFALGWLAKRMSGRLLARSHPGVAGRLRRLQIATSCGLAFAHGTNDAQKGMGIVALVLMLGRGDATFHVPTWAVLLCATTIACGTLAGGWRIIRTLGYGIYRIRPEHALDSQLASALVIFVAGQLGGPVSTSQVVATSIMGTGAAEHPRRVRWQRAREIAITWLTTIPAAGLVGAAIHAVAEAVVR